MRLPAMHLVLVRWKGQVPFYILKAKPRDHKTLLAESALAVKDERAVEMSWIEEPGELCPNQFL